MPRRRRALTLNAASLIVAHNHPSGGVEPSANDRRLTRVLQDSLALIDVRLLDHPVVTSNEVFSFSRQGWIPAGVAAEVRAVEVTAPSLIH
jgi:DNA repair protein RadC